MSRALRIEYPHALYHITSRGNSRQKIFKNKNDYNQFLLILKDVLDRYNWICHAYCLMPNHYHLLIETPDANLSRGMRQLNGVYTQKFNYNHKIVGHLLQGRYKAIVVEKEKYLYELIRYIVLNPVKAKLAKRPENWVWSSYREIFQENTEETIVNKESIIDKFESLAEYRKFINQKRGDENVWEELYSNIVLGSIAFRNKLQEYISRDKRTTREIPKNSRMIGRPSLDDLFRDVTKSKEERNHVVYKANVEYGYSLTQIGDYLGIHYSTLSKIIKNKRIVGRG